MRTVENYWKQKRKNAKMRGIQFLLSLDDMKHIFERDGITPDDIGRDAGSYCLGRKCAVTGNVDGDLPYSIDTCRFIPFGENSRENLSNGTSEKISEAMKNPSTRKLISESRAGSVTSEETKAKMSAAKTGEKNHFFNKTHTDESRKKIREARAKQGSPTKGMKMKRLTCPHCGTIGGGSNMTRYHFDNCEVLKCRSN